MLLKTIPQAIQLYAMIVFQDTIIIFYQGITSVISQLSILVGRAKQAYMAFDKEPNSLCATILRGEVLRNCQSLPDADMKKGSSFTCQSIYLVIQTQKRVMYGGLAMSLILIFGWLNGSQVMCPGR